MIRFDNVTKKYGSGFALRNVSFQFEKGNIYGLLGPNGSGKSTTLKMIAGLVLPSSGYAMIDDQPINRKMAKEIAYLTELDMFYETFTVKGMLKFYASQFGDFDMERAEELVTFMQLDPKKKIRHLSKGKRGRLKLVLTLSRRAKVILLDEPFSGLDPMVRDVIVKGLLSYIDWGEQTVLIATHEIDEIEAILDEAYIIQNGEMKGHCNVEQLREEKGLSVLQWLKCTIKTEGMELE
ncbi:putative ABC transporter ATP-binding protein YhcG [Rossellomorea marisflavi]|uniref:ABC transporter ATP-binding protein n=1 Tax=Rossellomorea marisflavi TaxID=189381 RepID=UPI0025CAF36E|nr:ABC transporter ATP-binding protein [Rossellomorea marisflavi]GLI84786.1 putative ABC transporter ATP-binding protein YhcG [Rossellomorea marisflavi]